jgi:hypothetical protein
VCAGHRTLVARTGAKVVGKHARHRRQVADIAVDDVEKGDDRGLVRGDAVEIAHRKRIVWDFLRWLAFVPRVLSSPKLAHRSSSPRLTKSNAFFDQVSYTGRTGALHVFQNLQDRSIVVLFINQP